MVSGETGLWCHLLQCRHVPGEVFDTDIMKDDVYVNEYILFTVYNGGST